MACRPVRYIKDKEGKFVESKFWNSLYQKFSNENLADKYYKHYIEYYSSNNKTGNKLNGKHRFFTELEAKNALKSFSEVYDNVSYYKVPDQALWVITIPKPKQIFTVKDKNEDFKRDLEYFNGDYKLFEQESDDLQYSLNQEESKDKQISLQQFKEIADKLAIKTGIPYKVVTPQEALDILKSINVDITQFSESTTPAFYSTELGGLIVFPDNYLNSEVAFHEFSHPFVDAITRDNKALFLNLRKQLSSTPSGQEIIKEVKNNYKELLDKSGELSEKGWKEAIVTALGKMADNQLDEIKDKSLISALKLMLKRIGEYLQSLFADSNRVIKPVEITADTTLDELASMLHLKNKIDVNSSSDEIQLSKRVEYKNEIKNILENSKDTLDLTSNLLNKTNDPFIKEQLKNLIPFIKKYDNIRFKQMASIGSGQAFYTGEFTVLPKEHLTIEDFIKTYTHELYHVISINELFNNNKFNNFITNIRRDYIKSKNLNIEEIESKKNTDFGINISRKLYGFLNNQEFIAEVFSNEDFSKSLDNTKIDNEERSLFKKIIDYIYNLFNKNTNSEKLRKLILSELKNKKLEFSNEGIFKDFADNASSRKDNNDWILSPKNINVEEQNYQATTDKVLNTLKKQLSIYEKRAKGSKLTTDLRKLITKIETNEDSIESINLFIDDANEWIAKSALRFNSLKEKLDKGIDELSVIELAVSIDEINELNQFSSTYNILDDISYELNNLTSTPIDKMGNMLSNSISLRRQIQKEYQNYSVDLIAQWLWNNNPELKELNKNLKKEGQAEFTIDQLKAELRLASSDITSASRWLQATISSKDPFSGLLARTLNKRLEAARIENFNIRKELTGLYQKKTGYKDNPRAFNKAYIYQIDNYEYVGKDEEGEPIYDYVKRDALITEYNYSLFEKNRNDFFKELGERPTDPKKRKAYNKLIAKWFNENQTLANGMYELIESKAKQLNSTQFNQWWEANTEEVKVVIYADGNSNFDFSKNKIINPAIKAKQGYFFEARGELLRPSDKYKNKEWPKLMQDTYFAKLTEIYNNSNDQLPYNQRLKNGLLPQKEADLRERLLGGTSDLSFKAMKEGVKRTFTALEGYDESKYGLTKLSGSNYKQIPILYTRLIDPKLVSHDLLESILSFAASSNRFRELYSIEAELALTQDIIANREVAQTTTLGKQKTDSVTGEVLTKQDDKKVNEQLNTFINMVYYGEANEMTNIEIGGKTISVDKTVALVTKYTSISSLALNVASSVTNSTWGNYQTFSEAGGKLYSRSDWASGFKDFHKYLPDVIADFTRQDKTSFLGQLADYMDCIQGNFEDHLGNNVSGTAFKKLINTSSLFFLQHGTEFQIQTTGMLAMMKGKKIKDKQGNEVTLLQAYEDNFKKNGNFDLSKDYNFSENERYAFMKQIHATSKDLHGIYNSFDKPALQRLWYGKLALLFRKHIYRGWMRRYQKGQSDFEGMDYKEGYYRTFFSTLRKDIKDMGAYLILRQNKLTERQKTAINKTIMDIVALTGVILLIAGVEPDKKNKEKQGFMAATAELYARRFKQDLIFSSALPTPDTWRVLRTPTVAMSTIEKLVRWIDQAFLTWDKDKLEYQKRSGLHEKGDNKAWARFEELIPIVNSIQNLLSPEEMNKIYNR